MKRRATWLAAAPLAAITALVPFGAEPAGAETLAVFTKSSGNPVARAVRAGAEQVAKANGFTVFNYIPTSPDNANQQTGLVDAMLRDKRDAVVFTPVDVKIMIPAVQKINAAGIPLVNVTDKIAGGNIDAFVNTDDYSIALDTARMLLKAMDGKGNLVVLDGPDTVPTAAARARGFKDALKEFPNVKVTLSKNAQYARPVAKDLFTAMLKLSSPPPVDGVLAANDAMALGAIEAYKELKKKLPLVVGINASKEAVDLIKAGEMLASGDYTGHIDGCIGAEIAIKLLHKQAVPKEVTAKSVVVDKTNLAPYEIPVERRMCPTLESLAAK
jgi:ribose transport system substrate-binding protein